VQRWVSKHLALSYTEFSHTAKYLLMSGVTQDLELLHAVNQIEKTNAVYWELSNLVDQIKCANHLKHVAPHSSRL